jgi:carbon monoxide dehydrogenase subunit G
MKLREEFRVDEPVGTVWKFFRQSDLVAACMPGVESVTVIDEDNIAVRATQSIGPMTATFEGKVKVLDRVENELISFQATGKSVRGAVGHVRTTNSVRLYGSDGSTTVVVDGDLILAGALGSVGQKVISRQASKVTAEFANNLQLALHGDGGLGRESPAITGVSRPKPLRQQPTRTPTDPWARAAACFSALSAALSLIALLRSRRASQ